MADRVQEDINAILQRMDHQHDDQPADALPGGGAESRESEAEPAITETIHVYFVRESELAEPADEQVVESTLATSEDDPVHLVAFEDEPLGARTPNIPEVVEHAPPLDLHRRASLARWTAGVGGVLLLTIIAFQVLLTFLTPTPTITLVPVVRDLSTTTIMMAVSGTPTGAHIPARLLPSLTLIQTKTAIATGKGHQDAEAAMGTITFYNGLFTSQTIVAGTTLTSSDGVRVITDQPTVIPAALATTPPTYGQVTVSAHALEPGPQGNIPVRGIDQACCLPSVLAQNTAAFQGGHNERDYTVVTRADIDNVVSNLTTTLIQSGQVALAAQLSAGEALVTPACKPEVIPDHQPGAEATAVTVTVSEQCKAIAYESAALRDEATRLFARQATRLLGTHYSLIGAIQVHVVHAELFDKKRGMATIAVHVEGIWAYRFSQDELEKIKKRIAGYTLRQARQTLLSLPGIERVDIDSMAENQRLPKDTTHFHILLLYGEI